MAYRDDIDRDQYGRRYSDDDDYERDYRGSRTQFRGRYTREGPYRTARDERLRSRSTQDYDSRSEYGRYGREGWREGYQDMDLDRGEMDRETIGTRRLRRDYEGRDYDEFSQLDRERDFIRPQSRGEFGFASESQFDYGRQRSGPRIGVESGSQFGYGRQGSEPRMYGRRSTGQARSYSDLDEDRGWLDRLTDAIASWFGDEEAARRRRMDERHHQQQEQQQKYRGVGPKGYRRSDERIREEINDHLTDNDYLDATFIEVTVTGGEVMLDGIVRDRFSKRLAEDISDRVLGVQNVENRLKVSQLMQPQSETGSQQAVTPPPASKATTTKGS